MSYIKQKRYFLWIIVHQNFKKPTLKSTFKFIHLYIIFIKEAGCKSSILFLLRLSTKDTFFLLKLLFVYLFLDKADPFNEIYFVVDVPLTKLVETLSISIRNC